MRKKVFKLISVLIVLLFIKSGNVVFADDEEKVSFSVNPVITGTQLDYSKSFFYVQTKPGEKQELVVKVSSLQKEPIDVEVSIDNAISTESGIIDFSEPELKNETLKNPINEILTTKENSITIENFETKDVVFELSPPAEHYNGIKWGAITFKVSSGQEMTEMVRISNQYRIGVLVSESGDTYNNGQTMNLLETNAKLSYGRKVIEAAVENPEPKTIENLHMNAELIDKKTNEVLKTKKADNYAFAPNSTMPIVFDWGLSNLKAGDYLLKINFKNDENEWNLEDSFKLTGDQVQEVNSQSPVKLITPKWMKITVVALGLYTLITTVILVIRQKKWKKQVAKSKRKKNRRKGSKK